ncbi:MAG TPA: pantoate--beta-alanine ligase [Clostridiales bacterium]|nr:pantoate--beta-alanine ligase [Clostridiales bacterium]
MILYHSIETIHAVVRDARDHGQSIGLVPTMGFLHAGHRSLIERACRENDRVIVSIFVNPTQFGPREDFTSYPRDLPQDLEICQDAGADWVFAPDALEMYPSASLTGIDVSLLGDHLCGASRPGHFRGVCLVVAKLFNICQPDRAYFGEKDAQQLAIIRQMTSDLNFPVKIIGCPIVREADGLALSSRNTYLSPAERQAARVVPRAIGQARQALLAGERDADAIRRIMADEVAGEPLARADYLEIADSRNLQPVSRIAGSVLVAAAVYIGRTRLIDNLTFIPEEG